MGWIEFCAAFLTFFAVHRVPTRPPIRAWLIDRVGRPVFGAGYGLLSLAALAWVIGAAGRAPYVALWPMDVWQMHLALTVMLVACVMLTLSAGRANPFSFGGGDATRFDPARPGLVRWMRHPLLVALALWAGVHTLANGSLAHVILFGAFTAFALFGQRLIDRRKQREMGADWENVWRQAREAPFAQTFAAGELAVRLGAGVALFAALLALHPWLFGVSPWPF